MFWNQPERVQKTEFLDDNKTIWKYDMLSQKSYL